ncbi:3-oxoacyl-[acyl-carrier protein] reductase [Bacillus sp. JCM 19046]|nr:3-oxoacyl-[acyl-carrier protein] reductase [Bacillus sp. JCM 19045]GAF17476.1 3-oxoacyl-[acyl-carrier protein] reductase [Bacillus sp. JCM 19046]
MAENVAIITGAAAGIGRATAIALAEKETPLALIDQNKEKMLAIKKQYPHVDISIYQADIGDARQQETVFRDISANHASISFLFANAGINGTFTSIEEFSPEDWDKTIQTNLTGTFLSIKYAIPLMKQKGGSIVITSSVNGTRVFSNVGMSAYSSSKAALVAFGKMAALELSHYHIRVNILLPGAIQTDIDERTYRHDETLKDLEFNKKTKPFPTPAGTPEQVAETVLFLASDASKHISGTEIIIDAAQTLV